MDALRWRDEQRRLRAALAERRGAGSSQVEGAPRPFVSVVVVCWNAAGVIERCLEHLLAQDYRNREIVVVDDGSDDDTFEIAERVSAERQLTLVRSTRNRGCPAARNLGLRHAGGEIVAFIDADGYAAPSWLTNVVEAFGEDQTIGGVASTVFYDDNPLLINGAGGTVNRQGWAADLAMNQSYEHAELAVEALYPMGCGMAVRRSAVQRTGPFDDRMLNYYDDVDYGIRLWRAGYRVVVAHDAWVDHGAAVGESARKQLLCERHRMRVVLKHAQPKAIVRWVVEELRAASRAQRPARLRKLRSYAWNLVHLPSIATSRWRLRRAVRAPERLLDPSWGDAFPVGVPLRLVPVPDYAAPSIAMGERRSREQLVSGWFPLEATAGGTRRWAGPHAVALVRVEREARKLRLEYAQPPVDIGGVEIRLRKLGVSDPGEISWSTHLPWSYTERAVENHPLVLAAGDYEVCFDAARGWSDPPRETRSIAFALSELVLSESYLLPGDDGLRMEDASAERQLVRGWYEREHSSGQFFRWGAKRAEVVVRAGERARGMRIVYRAPPGDTGRLGLAVLPFERGASLYDGTLPPAGDWREEFIAVDLAPGDYVVSFEVERTWSNPLGDEAGAPAEARALGFALSSLRFLAAGNDD